MIPNLTGNISPLLNVVPTPGAMTLIPIKMQGPVPLPNGLPYVVMFNPDHVDESKQVRYSTAKAHGSDGGELKFDKIENNRVNFEFIIDGTGASGDKREVMAEIELFRVTTGFNGSDHKPNYLALIWGTFIFQGYLTAMSVKYTLFRPNGTPLRARLNCTFLASTTNLLRVLSMGLLSPDLTHKHLVKTGERLDNLSQRYYENPRHHLSIAQANGLTSPRSVKEGSVLFMPPLEK